MAEDWVGNSMTGAGLGAGAGTAVLPGLGTAIGAGIGFIVPIRADWIGRALSSGDQAKADQLMQQAIAQFGPDVLKAPEIAQLTPHLGPSAFAGAESDPAARAAQQQALQKFGALSDPNNLQFRAAANQAEMQANQQAGAQQGAVRQQMQAHGMGGSGVDYALRQRAGSDAANRSASMGFAGAMAGAQQAQNALGQYAGLASTIRGQSWDEASRKAAAADEVNRFNEMGRVAGAQQNWQNQMGLAGARAGALEKGAAYASGKVADTRQQWDSYGQGAGQGAGAIGQYVQGQSTSDAMRRMWEEQDKSSGRYGAGSYG
jgi:hypothetical protein